MSETKKTESVVKTNKKLGLVFGYGYPNKNEDGSHYTDLHGDQITDEAITKMALGFAKSEKTALVGHDKTKTAGVVPFIMPITEDVKKAINEMEGTGLFIGMHIEDPEVLELVEKAKLPAFSIGFTDAKYIEVDEEESENG